MPQTGENTWYIDCTKIGEALMKVFSVSSFFCLGVITVSVVSGSQTLDEARRLERSGDAGQAHALLARAAQSRT